MNRLTQFPNTFYTINPAYYFVEIRDGMDWFMACHRDGDSLVLCFHEWNIDDALRTLGNWAHDPGKPWFDWNAASIMSERLRWHRQQDSLAKAFKCAGQDVEFYTAMSRCGCQVQRELAAELQRLELLRGCLSDVECGR
jgi:hypothetical protein